MMGITYSGGSVRCYICGNLFTYKHLMRGWPKCVCDICDEKNK